MMKYPKVASCMLGVWFLGGPGGACAPALAAPADAPSVLTLAEQLRTAAKGAPVGEDQIFPLCSDAADAADLVEAVLLVGVDVFTAVRDTILACGRGGNGAEVARQVGTRVLRTQGESARYLIDAGVLAAAAEIARRLRGDGTLAAARSPVQSRPPVQSQAQRDLERERLARMMQKGLIDDEYRRYIDERRALVESTDYAGESRAYDKGVGADAGGGRDYDYGDLFLTEFVPPAIGPAPGGVSSQ